MNVQSRRKIENTLYYNRNIKEKKKINPKFNKDPSTTHHILNLCHQTAVSFVFKNINTFTSYNNTGTGHEAITC